MKKDISLIVSAGRTGTKFLGRNIQNVFDDCISFHEPDSIHSNNWTGDLLFVCRYFGLYRGIIGKLVGTSGIRRVSDRYLAGQLGDNAAVEAIRSHRLKFYNRLPEQFIVESNYAFFGLLPLLPEVFPAIKIAAIVRDPFTWIKSYLRKDDQFGRRDYVGMLGLRITAPMIGTMSDAIWNKMSQAERLAWLYGLVYSKVQTAAGAGAPIRIWRYEDLFVSNRRETYFYELCTFIGDFEQRKHTPLVQPNVLGKRINAAPDREIDTTDEHIRQAIDRWCSNSAQYFGYV